MTNKLLKTTKILTVKTTLSSEPHPRRNSDICKLSWNTRLLALSVGVGILALAVARVLPTKNANRISDELALRLQSFDIPVLTSMVPSTYATRSDSKPVYIAAHARPDYRSADTTAVILNWSRLENVLLISALLCGQWLDDTITEVFVWNNNPNTTLTTETFRETGCSAGKLRIHNSPSNMLFQARFVACAEARTPYCFTQDDDYLVQPEVIKNLHFYNFQKLSADSESLHLLPAHEHLLSRLRTFTTEDRSITTAFAWLGHGTYLSRASARDFLHLLRALNVSDDEMAMADNYFTILANRPKQSEIWFDHGIELGGGQPFTVGSGGDTRNDRHIARALEYLSSLVSGQHPALNHPYVSRAEGLERLERLLPGASQPKLQRIDVAYVENRKLQALNSNEREWYIQNSLSYIVDARPHTVFRSFHAAKTGDWIVLDALGVLESRDQELELSLLLEESMEYMFRHDCSFSTSTDGTEWSDIPSAMSCISVKDAQLGDSDVVLRECSIRAEQSARYFKVLLPRSNSENKRWAIYEMWLRYLQPDL